MKCKLCNEKKGSTRCEGCDMLLCLLCMNKHHDELMKQFQQLMNTRNEVKELFDTTETTSCFLQINEWERMTIERIREIARKVRLNIEQIMAKDVGEIRRQLEQISEDMQQQEKEGNYLESVIEKVKYQLNQLNERIQHSNKKIQVTTSNNIDWDALIYIRTDTNMADNCGNSSEYLIQQTNNENHGETNQKKL